MTGSRNPRRSVLKSLVGVGTMSVAGCLRTPESSTMTDPASKTDTNDAEFVVSRFDVSTSKTAPTKQYFFRITDAYSTSTVEEENGDQTILDVSDVEDPAVRETLKDIILVGDDHWVRRDEIPDRLLQVIREVDFFTWESHTDPGDTYTHWKIEIYRAFPDRKPVIEFSAELVDDRITRGDPGAIKFSLSNTDDHTQIVQSGTVPPFSILWAEAPESKERALLWRDYVEEGEGCVNFRDDDSGLVRCDIGINVPIDPGETINRTYQLRSGFDREALAKSGFDTAGRYTVTETLRYYRDGEEQGPSTHVDWRVEFDLEEA